MCSLVRATAVATAALAVATACGDAVGAGSALYLGEGQHQACLPAPPAADDVSLFGDSVIRHESRDVVTIEAVMLVDAQDMVLREAYLVPLGAGGGDLVGVRHATSPAPFPPAWDDREPAVGADLAPGDVVNLVVAVETETTGLASSDAVRLVYSEPDGTRYQQDTVANLFVSAGPCPEVLPDS